MEQAQRPPALIERAPFLFWLRWVFANLVGGVAGGALGGVALHILLSYSSSDHGTLVSFLIGFLAILPWFTALLGGLALGLAQWLMLRTFLQGAPKLTGLGWILLTALGGPFAVFFTGGLAFSATLSLLVSFSFAGGSSVSSSITDAIPGLAATIAGGATIGFAQWLILSKYIRQAHWWILATSLGWLLGVVVNGIVLGLGDNWTLAAYSSLGYGGVVQTTIAGGVTSFIVGVLTGLLLIWLVQPQANTKLMPRMAIFGISLCSVAALAGFYSFFISANPAGQITKFQLSAGIRSVAFSPDGKYIAAGDANYTIGVWRIEDGQSVFSLAGTKPGFSEQEARQSGFTIAAWSHDGRYLSTTSSVKEHAIRVWDTLTWQPIFTSTIPADLSSVETTKEGTKTYINASTSVPGMAWSPSGERLAIIVANIEACCDNDMPDWSKIEIFDLPKGQVVETLVYSTPVLALAWSPDGSALALGAFDIVGNSEDHTLNKVVLWELAKGGGQAIASNTSILIAPPLGALSLDWTPDGRRLAVGVYGSDERVWDVTNNKYLSLPVVHDRTVNAISWSPDGRCLASASDDLTVKIVDVSRNTIISTFQHPRWATSVNWSPDGTLLATGSDDGGVRLWSAPK